MRLRKKIISVLLATAVVATGAVGCAKLDESAVALTVNEESLTAGEIAFYARYQASMMESIYTSILGPNMWDTEISEGVTYQDDSKNQIVESLKEMMIIEEKAAELGVELTQEEQDSIQEAVKAFIEANDAETLAKISGTEENITTMLTLQTLQTKAFPEIVKDAETDISDDEAAQKKMQFVKYSFVETNDAGEQIELEDSVIEGLKVEAESLLTEAMEAGELVNPAEAAGLELQEATFDAESTMYDAAVIAAADELEEGEFASVIEGADGYYVVMLESELDRAATDYEKEQIIIENENALYEETMAAWLEEAKVTVNAEQIKLIDFQDLSIQKVTPEVEETTDEESTDEESTDEEPADEESTDEESANE